MSIMNHISSQVLDNPTVSVSNNKAKQHITKFSISDGDVCNPIVSKEELLRQAEQLIDYYLSDSNVDIIVLSVRPEIDISDEE